MSRNASLGLLALLIATSPVRAADDVPPETAPVVAVTDTVVVIGARVSLDPRTAALAVTTIPASSWQEARTGGLDAPLGFVPGVNARSRAGSNDVRITSRGFGARGAGERSNAGTTRGIRITLDGFPLTEPDGRTSLDFADPALLERVSVIRSNSSTLFGPASGGLIALESTAPFDQPFGELRGEFGGFGYARQAFKAGFVSGSARLRVAASTGSFDGYREHSRGAQTTLFASAVTEASPATTVSVFLAATHNVQHQAGALTQAEFDADPTRADPSYVTQDARRDNSLARAATRLEHRFAGGQALQVGFFVEPKTLHRSERNRYRDFQRVHTGGSVTASGPLGTERLRWLAGVDEAWQDGSVLFYNVVDGGRGTTPVADQREGINTVGLFSELAVEPAAGWRAAVGARWDNVHYVSENHQEPALNAGRSLGYVSPRLSLSYCPAPERLYYAGLNGGIETPAFNEVDPPAPYDAGTSLNPLLEPSTSLTVEVGTRGTLRRGGCVDHVDYDVALYTLDVRNDIVPWDGGAYYLTAGKSRRSGVEIGLDAALAGGFSARLAGALTRNRYLDYETGVPGDGGLVTARYDGHETAGLPSVAVQGAVRWERPGGLFAECAAQRVGSYWANDANTDRVEACTIFDATVGSDLRVGGLDAHVFASVRNLADRKYAASAYVNGVAGRYLEPGMPRNVLLGITLLRR